MRHQFPAHAEVLALNKCSHAVECKLQNYISLIPSGSTFKPSSKKVSYTAQNIAGTEAHCARSLKLIVKINNQQWKLYIVEQPNSVHKLCSYCILFTVHTLPLGVFGEISGSSSISVSNPDAIIRCRINSANSTRAWFPTSTHCSKFPKKHNISTSTPL